MSRRVDVELPEPGAEVEGLGGLLLLGELQLRAAGRVLDDGLERLRDLGAAGVLEPERRVERHGSLEVGDVDAVLTEPAGHGSPSDQTATGTWAGPRTVVVCTISMRSSSTVHSGWRVSISSMTTAPFQPSEGGAEAEVGAVPERHVAVHVPGHVEAVGIGVLPLVPARPSR